MSIIDEQRFKERARQGRRQRRRDVIASYLFLAPYLLLLLMFGVLPIGYAFGLSFFDTFKWVFWGIANYQFVFADFRVPEGALNVLTFAGLWVTLTIVGVCVLALAIDTVSRCIGNALRTVFFLPGAVTSSAIVVLWLFVLDPSVSPFQPLQHMAGWITRQDVISGMGYAGVFAMMAYFASSGGWIVVMGGALSSLSPEVLEAARVDGASPLQLALRIKLPMIWRSVALMAILTLAAGLQIFVEPQLMMLGGAQYGQPDWSLNQLAFQYAFRMGDFGASAALSTMLVATSVAIAMVIVFVTKFYKID
ncbi:MULTISPECIES: carbohydrate ABC transporter permease [unclassified Ensifer]|uniref:carbohydrate ABC transporter permease n=1 Tax=unclassified Ensifer TaxID=2633371 RepID=UPI00042F4B9F|nr:MULTISPECIES: sugar ABC transporter permease [unclassified Ensifer]AHK46474.1 maltose ABC transporter permease protein [Ensifer adhaerens OV14]KQY76800.1 hypothetical protein ASD52_22465 [Ensifer sp. Root142]MBD9492231.1 sugar ABC transporter permease [Ensifer sp. ENS11]MDP9634802.1 multiple sugar transport system permease protein [Ensifer adhaerens]